MRARVTLLVAATTSVVLIAFLVPMAVLVGRVAAADAVNAAVSATQTLVPVVASSDLAAVRDVVGDGTVGDYGVTVYLPGGTAVGQPVPSGAGVRAATLEQTTKVLSENGSAVIYQPVFRSEGPAVIRTVVPSERLHRGVARTRLTLMALGVLLFALSLLVADQLARSMTRPVSELAVTAERLGAGDLAARVRPEGPAEVQDVGQALNRLAARIGELLVGEREAVADLSHRLRTPVTALRLDIEAVLDHTERTRLTADIDALDRMVGEVIREARRPVREGGHASCDAVAVVADRVAFWRVLAEDQGRPVALALPEHPVLVRASADDLAVAVDALLGNVFAHTPDGTAVRVEVAASPDGAVLTVEDDGPGLPDPGLLERGVSGSGSTGLGLDIVRRTAEATGGRVELGSAQHGGARITMMLGAAG